MSVFLLPGTGKMGVVDPMLRFVEGDTVAVKRMAGQLLRRWRGGDDEIRSDSMLV